jgi:arginase family enzyme
VPQIPCSFCAQEGAHRANLCDEWKQIDIALLGVPSDTGLSHRPGARYGPQGIRAQSGMIRYINPFTKVIPYELARVGDVGDADGEPGKPRPRLLRKSSRSISVSWFHTQFGCSLLPTAYHDLSFR